MKKNGMKMKAVNYLLVILSLQALTVRIIPLWAQKARRHSDAQSVPLPDLIIWGSTIDYYYSTETFTSTDCEVVEGCLQAGTHRLLRFNTSTRNIGTADLFFGDPVGNPLFEYAPCHGHYHFKDYARYELLDNSGQLVAPGFKAGFCLLDWERYVL